MTKHSNAPWHVGPVDDTIVRDADGNVIAEISGDYSDPKVWPVMEANSRLIASAPDLLEALEDVTALARKMMVGTGTDEEFADIRLEKQIAAIAKATNHAKATGEA